MNHIIDLDTYLRYRIKPIMPYIKTEEQKKRLIDKLSNKYEEACKKAEEFRNNYIKNGPDKGKAFVIDTRVFNILWFLLYEKGSSVKYNYDGTEIEIGKCICCKSEEGTWYVKTPIDTVYINA